MSKIVIPLQSKTKKLGSLAEWLGTGLQNRLQQFDSARNLQYPSDPIKSDRSDAFNTLKPQLNISIVNLTSPVCVLRIK